jgi:hypothetical protein
MKKFFLISTAILLFCTMALASKMMVDQHGAGQFTTKHSAKSAIYTKETVIMAIDFSVLNSCVGDSVLFINTSTITGDTFLNFLWNFGDSSPDIILGNPKHIYTAPGIYTVKLFALTFGGLKDSIFKTITVYPIPIVAITQNGNTLYLNGVFDSIQWYDSTGAIAGATAQSFTPTKNGRYWGRVTDLNGCSNISDKIYVDLTGINENNSENKVAIYPNPNSGILNLEITGLKNNPFDLTIYNTLGKVVLQETGQKFDNNSGIMINLSEMRGGIYYLKVSSGCLNVVRKVVVER